MSYIDAHCHYYLEENTNWLEIIEQGNTICILNGLDFESNEKLLQINSKSNKVKIALGIHPTVVDEIIDLDKNLELIKKNKKHIIAIGEIGLDFFHKDDNKEEQIKIFKLLLKLAEQLKLPVIIHSRNAVKEVLEIISKYKLKILLHCFEASKKNIEKAVEMGCYFTIPTSTDRNVMFQTLLEIVPISRIITETDAPFQGPIKGVSPKPKDIVYAIKTIAKVKGLDEKEVENLIYSNYMRLFLLN